MKKVYVSFIIIMFFLIKLVFAVDLTSFNYFPLKIGNSWTYHYTASGWGGYYVSYDYKVSIVDTARINSYFYFKSITTDDTLVSYFRIDSISGILSKYVFSGCYNLNHEVAIDSLNSSLGNFYISNCILYSILCSDTSSQNIFNTTTHSKKYEQHSSASYYRRYYYGFGLASESFVYAGGHYYSDSKTLKGCRINNLTYGDTNITNVNLINIQVPTSLTLSQNYPNPFNPQTKIKFAIPSNVRGQTSNVKLIIYDLLGREVTTLVNEELKPGTYEADWDGTNFSSGVYFYKIITNEFTETRKMVLMK